MCRVLYKENITLFTGPMMSGGPMVGGPMPPPPPPIPLGTPTVSAPMGQIGPQVLPAGMVDPATNNQPLQFNMNKGKPPMPIMGGGMEDVSGNSALIELAIVYALILRATACLSKVQMY